VKTKVRVGRRKNMGDSWRERGVTSVGIKRVDD
jgi:hypothetical protein